MNNKERGRKNKKKGSNFEYRIVYKAREKGLDTKRIDLSGAGKEKGDIVIEGIRYENKYRSSDTGLKTLYDWFFKAKDDGCTGLIIKVKGKPCLVILEFDDYLNLLGGQNEKANEFDS